MTVTATVHKDDPQFGRNKRRIQIKFVDHLSNISYSTPKLVATAYIIDLVKEKADKEAQQVIEESSSITDLASALAPIYTDSITVLNDSLNRYMNTDDVREAIDLQPIIDHIQTTYNPVEIRTIFNLTIAQSNAIGTKQGSTSGIVALLASADSAKVIWND